MASIVEGEKKQCILIKGLPRRFSLSLIPTCFLMIPSQKTLAIHPTMEISIYSRSVDLGRHDVGNFPSRALVYCICPPFKFLVVSFDSWALYLPGKSSAMLRTVRIDVVGSASACYDGSDSKGP